jgi:hypothetical protein
MNVTMRSIKGLAAVSAIAVAAFGATAAKADSNADCAGLAQTVLPHAQVTKVSVENLAAGTACRVSVSSKPTPDSDIGIEVWIPAAANWNGKFVQAGNGGYAGHIPSEQLKNLASQGYMAAGTDNGHQADGTDGTWALGHPEKFIDFGWRSLKETTVIAKVLIAKQTGRGPKLSYFSGCSDGGREGLMVAQRFPNDFDGIAAGAPGNYMARLMTMRAGYYKTVRQPGGYLDTPQLQLIQKAVLSKCDVTGSGFVRDPQQCKFDPGELLCKNGQTDECLTLPQLASLRAIYGGWHDPRTGILLFPGYEPGAEAQRAWKATILGDSEAALATSSSGYQFASSYLRYFVKGDPNYDISKLDMGAEAEAGVAKTAPIIDAENPDLSAFRKHGGKLLQYHGWNDQNIPARSSLRYFEAVHGKMGDTSNFYRLFMVPGMLHCGGGAAPTGVDWLSTLDHWVQSGTAPDNLIASETRGPVPQAPHPAHTQLLCPYPSKTELVGENSSEASSYRCTTRN